MAVFTAGTENNMGTHNANFKEVYADDIVSLIPGQFKIQKLIKLELGEKEIGLGFNQPVIVQDEQGVTYYDPHTDGAAALNAAVPAKVVNARVKDVTILIRTALAQDMLDRASSKGKKAFKSATELVVKSMTDCIAKRVEVCIVYGGSLNGIGRFTKSATLRTRSGSGATSKITIVMATGHWAPGIWAGAKGAKIQLYKQTDDSLVAEFTVDAVSFANKSLTFQGAEADVDAVIALLNTAGGNSDAVVRYSGAKSKEFLGLDVIVTNTGSLFTIDAATYDLWAGNETTSVGDLSITKMFTSIQKIVERGSEDEVIVLTSTRAWNLLALSDMTTAAGVPQNPVRDASYNAKSQSYGTEDIKLHGPLGMVKIVSSLYLKEGDTFILTLKTLKRMGNKDISFNKQGTDSEYFRQLEGHDGVELRCSTTQCLFCSAPLKNLKMSGITFPAGY